MQHSIICPLCQESLQQEQITFKCKNNHTFDLAKEGYLNLLLVNQKSSTDPGDDEQMVKSRRNFLEKQYYLPLSNTINRIVKNNSKITTSKTLTILDCGCGEGYYLNNLAEHFHNQPIEPVFCGLDISKSAIKLAATTFKKIFFLVSNLNYILPFADNSIHILLNIFAPKNPTEFSRVLVKNGILILVFPTPNHLKSLKNKLGINLDYDSKPDNVMNNFSGKFKLIDTEQIETTINLKSDDAIELIKMTPIYWQIDQKKLEKLGNISTEIGFNIYVFKKTN